MPTFRVEAAAEGMPATHEPFHREHEHPEEARFVRTLTVLDLKIIHEAAGAAEEELNRFCNQPRMKEESAISKWLDREMERLNDIKSFAMEELQRRPMTGNHFDDEERIGMVAKWDLHDCGAGFLETIAKLVSMKERAEKAEFEAKRAEGGDRREGGSMISRRDALKQLATGSALGLTGAVIVSTTSCAPTEAPAAEADPLLALIREYRTQLAIFNAAGDLTDEEDDTLAAATIDPPWFRLRDDCPTPTSMEGAIEAVRLVRDELRGGYGGVEEGVLAAAVAYFDRRAGNGA